MIGPDVSIGSVYTLMVARNTVSAELNKSKNINVKLGLLVDSGTGRKLLKIFVVRTVKV